MSKKRNANPPPPPVDEAPAPVVTCALPGRRVTSCEFDRSVPYPGGARSVFGPEVEMSLEGSVVYIRHGSWVAAQHLSKCRHVEVAL